MNSLRALGKVCAFLVSSKVVPPMEKYRLSSLSYEALSILRRPVLGSVVAPVEFVYASNASLAYADADISSARS